MAVRWIKLPFILQVLLKGFFGHLHDFSYFLLFSYSFLELLKMFQFKRIKLIQNIPNQAMRVMNKLCETLSEDHPLGIIFDPVRLV